MSFSIEVESGSTVRLPTKGKYCARDIVVTATGGNVAEQSKLAMILETQDVNKPYEITQQDIGTATVIPQYFFHSRTGLAAVNVPDAKTIGDYAFYGCSNLATVNIPNVERIGSYAFQKCSKLETLNAAALKEIGSNCFYYCTKLKVADFPIFTSVPQRGFCECAALKTANIPNVTKIGNWAFEMAVSLTSVNMQSVQQIGSYAFQYCYALQEVTIPATCTNIGSASFDRVGQNSPTGKCTFIFEGTTPPIIATNTFSESTIEKIIVPIGCGEIYKAATNWAALADYIEEVEV